MFVYRKQLMNHINTSPYPALSFRGGGSQTETERWTDRKMDRQAGRQTDRQEERQTVGQSDRETDRNRDRDRDINRDTDTRHRQKRKSRRSVIPTRQSRSGDTERVTLPPAQL